jgi:septal ring factor EnvC (AmiA/AmiB activator)
MKIVDLKKDMDAQFGRVDAQFARVDAQFARVDAQFARVDERFAGVDARFASVDARFDSVDARFDSVEARIQAEHETTRRHMDIWAEQLRAEMRLYSEQAAAMVQRLDAHLAKSAQDHASFLRIFENHEARITTLEQKSN